MCIFQYKRNVTVSQEISIIVLLVIIGSIQKAAEKLHFIENNLSKTGPEAQILVVNLSPISINFDTTLHKWLKFDPGSQQINSSQQVISRKKPLLSRTSSTAKRAKSYARGICHCIVASIRCTQCLRFLINKGK